MYKLTNLIAEIVSKRRGGPVLTESSQVVKISTYV